MLSGVLGSFDYSLAVWSIAGLGYLSEFVTCRLGNKVPTPCRKAQKLNYLKTLKALNPEALNPQPCIVNASSPSESTAGEDIAVPI